METKNNRISLKPTLSLFDATAINVGAIIRPVAIAITAIFAVLNVVGTKSSATFNNILVAAKILILFFFIGLGSLHINYTNLSPFNPLGPGVLFGAYFIFFAFSFGAGSVYYRFGRKRTNSTNGKGGTLIWRYLANKLK